MWRGPLPVAAADESFTLPLSTDIELEEFLIIRDSKMSKELYLAMVTEIHELYFIVECWGCTRKTSHHKGTFKIDHILKDGIPTTMIPHKDVTSTP